MKRVLIVVLGATLAFVLGCGDDDDSGGDSGPAACRAFVDAAASTVAECSGQSYTTVYAQLEAAASNDQGCDAIIKVKDESQFNNSCMPGVRGMTCDDWTTGNIPESCSGQLLYLE